MLIATTSGLAQPNAGVSAGQLLQQQRDLERASSSPAVPPKTLPRPDVPPIASASNSSSDGVSVVVREFHFSGNVLLSTAALQRAIAPWVGRAIALRDLRAASAAIAQLYRQNGWLAQASLPAQDITSGVVRIEIIEGKVGEIRWQEAKADRPLSVSLQARVQSLLTANLPADQPLNLFALERALLIANELPGVAVTGSLAAGEKMGRADVLLVTASAGRRWQSDLSVDNSGLRATGTERLNFQSRLNSFWKQGEQLDLFVSKTAGSDYAHLGLTLPIALRRWSGWRLGVNASALRYRVRDAMNITTGLAPEGSSQTYRVDLQYPLIRTPAASASLAVGYESKRQHNEDDNEILHTLTVTSHSRTPAFTLGFSGNRFDRWAGGGVNAASLLYSRGTLDLNGSPGWLIGRDAQMARTQGGFQKLHWSVSRLQALRRGFSLFVSAVGQITDENLDASEKFYLGGTTGVRAYPGGEADGSSGHLANVEVRKQFGAHWDGSAFYDWGQVKVYRHNTFPDGVTPLTLDNGLTLQGAGLSVGWRGSHGWRAKATWARRIGDNPLKTPSGADSDGSHRENRFWFDAGFAF